jgi:DNA polymerase-3 subunit gamma/tau
VFVLATTELNRVPDTILSRCQTFQFKNPSHETLKKLVLDVAKKEGASLAPAGAELIALMGDGSFRDTLSILQKVLTVSQDNKLSEEEVAKVVGAPSSKTVNDFLEALAAKNVSAALTQFHTALAGGVEPKVFCMLAVARVRGVLLLRFAPELKKELGEQFSDTDIDVLHTLAGAQGAGLNAALLAELITALLEMGRAPIPAIPLELALYRVFAQ